MQDFISHKDQTHSKPVTDGWTPDIPSLLIGLLWMFPEFTGVVFGGGGEI